jgi:DNA polymerase III epsilon subunit-like protein
MASEDASTGFVYYDFETTGVDVKNDRIVSVAASCRDERFYSLVNPTVPIPPGASNVHKIFDEHVTNAPTWDVVAPLFFEFVARHGGPRPTLVAYNGNRFDNPLLVVETKRAAAGASVTSLLERLFSCDAYAIARDQLPKLPSKSLGNCSSTFTLKICRARTRPTATRRRSRASAHMKRLQSTWVLTFKHSRWTSSHELLCTYRDSQRLLKRWCDGEAI